MNPTSTTRGVGDRNAENEGGWVNMAFDSTLNVSFKLMPKLALKSSSTFLERSAGSIEEHVGQMEETG